MLSNLWLYSSCILLYSHFPYKSAQYKSSFSRPCYWKSVLTINLLASYSPPGYHIYPHITPPQLLHFLKDFPGSTWASWGYSISPPSFSNHSFLEVWYFCLRALLNIKLECYVNRKPQRSKRLYGRFSEMGDMEYE